MMRLDMATADYIGARSQQQDAAAAQSFGDDGAAVLILGDGLGGHTGGAEASQIVIETFKEAASAGAFEESVRRRQALRDALDKANDRIAGGVDPTHGQRGMASTAIVAVVAEGEVAWISVGDSHLYVWRGGRLAKLNEDHSQAGLMLRSGQYKPSDPEVQAAKSVLVSALTGRKLELVDHPSKAFTIEAGDVLLLASDGLNTLSEKEVEAIVTAEQAKGARQLSATLLETVRDRRQDRQDNTTVAVARVIAVPVREKADPTLISGPTHQITTPTEAAIATGDVTERIEPITAPGERLVEASPLAASASATAASLHEHIDRSAPTVRIEPIALPEPVATDTLLRDPEFRQAAAAAESSRQRGAGPMLLLLLGLLTAATVIGLAAYFKPMWLGLDQAGRATAVPTIERQQPQAERPRPPATPSTTQPPPAPVPEPAKAAPPRRPVDAVPPSGVAPVPAPSAPAPAVPAAAPASPRGDVAPPVILPPAGVAPLAPPATEQPAPGQITPPPPQPAPRRGNSGQPRGTSVPPQTTEQPFPGQSGPQQQFIRREQLR